MKADGAVTAAGLVILCFIFPPLGFALLFVVVLGLFCFAGSKTVEAATPADPTKTPAQREYDAASAFGWLVFIVVVILLTVYFASK